MYVITSPNKCKGVLPILLLLISLFTPIPDQSAAHIEYAWWLTGWVYVFLCVLLLLYALFIPKKKKTQIIGQELILWILLIMGMKEVFAGLLQLFDFQASKHSLYSFTGSFYNPGPYGGFLSIIFPIAFYKTLYYKERVRYGKPYQLYYHFTFIICLLLGSMIIAGASRAAWCASLVSLPWVYYHFSEKNRQKVGSWIHHRRKYLWIFALGMLVASIIVFGLKKDSALGRIFIWKICCLSIAESPMKGYGKGTFEGIYGQFQENYFSNPNYAEWEERVAGCPHYAFNEYVQIAVEYGIPILIGIISLFAICFFTGLKKRRIAACGGLLAFFIFSFFSYPSEFPAFSIAVFFLTILCCGNEQKWSWLLLACISGIVGCSIFKSDIHKELSQWNECRIRYRLGAYDNAKDEYEKLYPTLKKEHSFLFEYGHCLHKLHDYNQSNQILYEAEKTICDPIVLNIIGKNYVELKQYTEAEEYFIRSSHRLPNRIYPYYLLAKLYAEPQFRQPEKFKKMADKVLHKKPKVYSKAIEEMREEIKNIAKERHLPI